MRTVLLTNENVVVTIAAGHPIYLVRTPDAAAWKYDRPITVPELPGVRFKRHLFMYGNRGHAEALELELQAGPAPARQDLVGKHLVQV